MNPKVLFTGTVAAVILVSVGLFGMGGTEPEGDLLAAAAAFNQVGYDRSARIYNGTGVEWCTSLGYAEDCLGFYSTGSLMFGWNAQWEKGMRETWVMGPRDARFDILFAGEKYHVVWTGPCTDGSETDDGVCVWGEFRATGELGADPRIGAGKAWFTTARPDAF